jgi:hypothetical protein
VKKDKTRFRAICLRADQGCNFFTWKNQHSIVVCT